MLPIEAKVPQKINPPCIPALKCGALWRKIGKSTWISRESDREIYNRTLERLLSLENSLMLAIKEYNTALSLAKAGDIAGLTSATAD